MPTLRKKDTALNINSKGILKRIAQIGKRRRANPYLTSLKHVLPTFWKQ
jgi:hypothetical protein